MTGSKMDFIKRHKLKTHWDCWAKLFRVELPYIKRSKIDGRVLKGYVWVLAETRAERMLEIMQGKA